MKLKALVLLATVWLAACSQSQRVAPIATTDPGTLQAMYQELYAQVQDRTWSDPSACTSLPLGSKPCGGPWTFLVYSKEGVDEAELHARATQLAAYELQYDLEYHVISTCDMAPPANPACVDGVCTDLNRSE
jgi:hypothetical protein